MGDRIKLLEHIPTSHLTPMRGAFIHKDDGGKPHIIEHLALPSKAPPGKAGTGADSFARREGAKAKAKVKTPPVSPALFEAEERVGGPQSFIQWPTDRQFKDLCEQLKKVRDVGTRNEALGDHFNSGDLAYQLQELIRAAGDLFQKSQRISKRGGG